ncbi:hypothetical protein ABZP36_032812 [Zizania latifolia]
MALDARFLVATFFVAATWLCLSVVASASVVPSVAFMEGFSPLFSDGNLVCSWDDRSVRLFLDRRFDHTELPICTITPLVPLVHLLGLLPPWLLQRVHQVAKAYTASVVVAFYLSNGDVYEKTHDELDSLDFEFLGSRWGGQWQREEAAVLAVAVAAV